MARVIYVPASPEGAIFTTYASLYSCRDSRVSRLLAERIAPCTILTCHNLQAISLYPFGLHLPHILPTTLDRLLGHIRQPNGREWIHSDLRGEGERGSKGVGEYVAMSHKATLLCSCLEARGLVCRPTPRVQSGRRDQQEKHAHNHTIYLTIFPQFASPPLFISTLRQANWPLLTATWTGVDSV